MAIDGANLNGAFPIFDTSKSVGTYTVNLQRQAAQRAAEQKALQDDLGKIKIDGLRDADKDDYFKGFEDWRSTAQAASKEKDFRTKAQLQSDSDRKYLELQSLVNKSKEYGKMHQDVSGRLLDNKFRDQFTDDAVDKWRKSGQLPLSNKEIVLDPTALGRQLDLSGIQKKITDIDENLLKQAKYANPQTRRVTSGNRQGTESVYSRSVDPQKQALEYGMAYDVDRDLRAYIQKQYANEFASMPEEQAKAYAIQDLVKQRPVARQDAPKVDWDLKEDNWKEKALFADSLARAREKAKATGQDEDVIYRQNWVNDIWNKVPGSGEKLKAAVSANASYSAPLKVNMNNGNLSFVIPDKITTKIVNDKPQTEAIPGRTVTIRPDDQGAKTKINALLTELTGENISESKMRAGNSGGKVKSGSSTTTSRSISFSKAEENGINAVMKQSGATRDEVIEALKKAGKIK